MTVRGRAAALFGRPLVVGRLTLPPPGLVLLAAIGSVLLVVVAVTRWGTPSDEFAYWQAAQRLVAGQPLYDATLAIGTPYAYWYPPPLAQVLAPLTLVLADPWFVASWTVLLLACLWFLGGRQVLVALALVAYVPVAVELWYRNVHLVLALLVVLALRRSPLFWIPAAAIKVTPVLGIVYLLAARRWRDVMYAALVGAAVLGISVLLSPTAWHDFLAVAFGTGGTAGASLVPIPFPIRLAAAVALAVVAGMIGGHKGEAMLVIALVVGNPTLWMTAFSMLVAIVPLWRTASPTARAAA